MQKQAIPKEPVASYKEVRIGKTLYRVTSVFSCLLYTSDAADE